MRGFLVKPCSGVKGKLSFAGDKSISQRCLILSSLSEGKTAIDNFPIHQDSLATIRAFRNLGIKIRLSRQKDERARLVVFGRGLYGLKRPAGKIHAADSGTTFRLLLGVLAGQEFPATLTAGKSLSRRPMLRVNSPLRLMGAQIKARRVAAKSSKPQEEYPPITIKGKRGLRPIKYKLKVASAQVKSAILLAGLYAEGATTVIEPVKTRDHTERLLKLFKADIRVRNKKITIKGKNKLVSPGKLFVPGDISSAGFFAVLAALAPGSSLRLNNLSLNSLRIGWIKVLQRMRAKIKIEYRVRPGLSSEPMGDITVESGCLKATTVREREVPSLIDELPILMVAASLAGGTTVFKGVNELRVKETDRIKSVLDNLKRMGALAEVKNIRGSENIIIKGVKKLKGARLRSFADHRTAMSLTVAALLACGDSEIDDIACINKSFPGFLGQLKAVS